MDKLRKQNDGFVTAEMVDDILELDRFEKLLVRTSMGRFICSVQDVRHFVDMVENSKDDYVRDVQFATWPSKVWGTPVLARLACSNGWKETNE